MSEYFITGDVLSSAKNMTQHANQLQFRGQLLY